jgi:hypothetical protein
MRRYLGIALVVLLAGLGTAGGYFLTAAYLGARGSLAGMQHACVTLQIAETKQVITRQQRGSIADELMRDAAEGSGDKKIAEEAKRLVDYLNGDCSRSIWETRTKAG